jgi:hypothetical protein
MLYYFLKRIEEGTGAGFGVTLYMKGLIVEGMIVQSKKYYDQLLQFFDEVITMKDNLDSTKKEKFEKYKKYFKVSIVSRIKNSSYDQEMYIHLDNATIFQSGSDVGRYAFLWRGKLSSVDSFSIGNSGNRYEEVKESK